MAATMSAWAKPGAWALDAEENETELLQQSKEDKAAAAVVAGNGHSKVVAAAAEFPSLSAAAATKTKKKKAQPISLQEFTAYGGPKPAAAPQAKGLTADELLSLPTGPRERTAEELDRNKLGGGFRSYGGGMRGDEQTRRQGSFNRDSNREFERSRADENDDWGAGKKSGGYERRERGERGGFFPDSQSRADEVDNWASKKSFMPSEPRRSDRRGGFGLDSSNGGADSDNWSKRKEEGQKTAGAFDSLRDRRGGFDSNGADSESWGKKREEGSGGGRPRLNLQPRTLPVEVQKTESASPVKPKGSNPFGEARPREEVLKEKGQDWKEIEEKLESTRIKEVVGSADGPAAAKRSFWSGNGRERSQHKTENAWRKPESVVSRPQSSAGGSENGRAENAEDEQAGKAEEGEAQI